VNASFAASESVVFGVEGWPYPYVVFLSDGMVYVHLKPTIENGGRVDVDLNTKTSVKRLKAVLSKRNIERRCSNRHSSEGLPHDPEGGRTTVQMEIDYKSNRILRILCR